MPGRLPCSTPSPLARRTLPRLSGRPSSGNQGATCRARRHGGPPLRGLQPPAAGTPEGVTSGRHGPVRPTVRPSGVEPGAAWNAEAR